jgi:hypothetical protein
MEGMTMISGVEEQEAGATPARLDHLRHHLRIQMPQNM